MSVGQALTLGVDRHGGDPYELLRRVAAETALRRAGATSRPMQHPAPSIPADAREPLPASAAAAIALAARGRLLLLLGIACDRASRRGWRLPAGLQAMVIATAEVLSPRDPRCVIGGPALAAALAAAGDTWSLAQADERTSLERLWHDGTESERLFAARALRGLDPALLRRLVRDGWRDEEAARRAELLDLLAPVVVAEDEPWLTAALGDRSQQVRARAAKALVALGEPAAAAFAERAWQRAAACVRVVSERTGILRRRTTRLVVEPPTAFVPAWADDGIVEKPPAGTGQRAWWLHQIVALAPIGRWCESDGPSPEELVALAARDEFGAALLDGWSESLAARVDVERNGIRPEPPGAAWGDCLGETAHPRWARPLAEACAIRKQPASVSIARLVASEAPALREALALDLAAMRELDGVSRAILVAALGAPWSSAVSRRVHELLVAGSSPSPMFVDRVMAERVLAHVHAEWLSPVAETLRRMASSGVSDLIDRILPVRQILDQELPP